MLDSYQTKRHPEAALDDLVGIKWKHIDHDIESLCHSFVFDNDKLSRHEKRHQIDNVIAKELTATFVAPHICSFSQIVQSRSKLANLPSIPIEPPVPETESTKPTMYVTKDMRTTRGEMTADIQFWMNGDEQMEDPGRFIDQSVLRMRPWIEKGCVAYDEHSFQIERTVPGMTMNVYFANELFTLTEAELSGDVTQFGSFNIHLLC